MKNAKSRIFVVFDTNVFVRAVAEFEEEHAAWGAMVRICNSLVVSEEILEEYECVIRKYGFNEYFLILKKEELKQMGKLRRVEMESGINVEIEIPTNDLPFLKTAIVAGASYIISQDGRHFIKKKDEIKKKYNIEVLRPREYYDMCEKLMQV